MVGERRVAARIGGELDRDEEAELGALDGSGAVPAPGDSSTTSSTAPGETTTTAPGETTTTAAGDTTTTTASP